MPRPPLSALETALSVVRQRLSLAFEPQPAGLPRPSLRLLAAELGEFRHGWSRSAPANATAQGGVPVLLLPGFFANPRRMRHLRRGLEAAGHAVSDWPFQMNLGATTERLDAVCLQIEALSRHHGRPVALVGWSLGGLYAREAARRCPQSVAMVITLGTPFSGDMRSNNAWRLYQLVTGQSVIASPIPGNLAAKPPVPTVAMWSARDGVIDPRAACGRAGERDEALALRCGHLGFVRDPAAISAICAVLRRN